MENNKTLAFNKINYTIMIVGLAVLTLGFWLMTFTTAAYGQGTLEMTVGPIVVAIGFLIEIVAIVYRSKKTVNE
jgi:uncharacterized membrane protein